MKKLILLSAVLALSACACMDSDEEEAEPVVYKTAEPKDMNCDYFDGKTCYRYVRRTRQIVAPAPVVRYREVARPCPQMPYVAAPVAVSAPAPITVSAPCAVASCGSADCCAPKVSETREPVEVTYKKTTYTTVYEPQTTASVNYERVPVNASQNVQVVQPQVVPVEVKTVAQPQPQVTVSAKPAEYVEYDSGEDILLNVK